MTTSTHVDNAEDFMALLVGRRKRANLTQEQVGQRMGVSQKRVSNIEGQELGTMEIRTLGDYIAAIGGTLTINYDFPEEAP